MQLYLKYQTGGYRHLFMFGTVLKTSGALKWIFSEVLQTSRRGMTCRLLRHRHWRPMKPQQELLKHVFYTCLNRGLAQGPTMRNICFTELPPKKRKTRQTRTTTPRVYCYLTRLETPRASRPPKPALRGAAVTGAPGGGDHRVEGHQIGRQALLLWPHGPDLFGCELGF